MKLKFPNSKNNIFETNYLFGAFLYIYSPVFIITSHLLFLKAHFLVRPNASLLGKIYSPAGRRITS
jgi:hypothetical protein